MKELATGYLASQAYAATQVKQVYRIGRLGSKKYPRKFSTIKSGLCRVHQFSLKHTVHKTLNLVFALFLVPISLPVSRFLIHRVPSTLRCNYQLVYHHALLLTLRQRDTSPRLKEHYCEAVKRNENAKEQVERGDAIL